MKQGFVIHWNGPPAKCVGADHERCKRFWAAIRNYHVNTKGWSDIAYSFGMCPHGIRFTGRGWYKNQFANGEDVVGPEDGSDATWYTVIVFLGEGEKPTAAMVDGTRTLIAEGRKNGRCGTRVLPHNAFKVKTCPGPEFTAYAKAWDNATLVRPAPTPAPTPVKEGLFMHLTEAEEREILAHARSEKARVIRREGSTGMDTVSVIFGDAFRLPLSTQKAADTWKYVCGQARALPWNATLFDSMHVLEA